MAAPDTDASAALAAASAVGPYFTVRPWTAGAGWRRLLELLDAPGALGERVDSGAETLAGLGGADASALETRVVASVVSLGLFARLVSPPLASTVLAGVVPKWSVESLWWRPVRGGPWPVAVDRLDGWSVSSLDGAPLGASADLFSATVIEGVVAPVVRRVHEEFSVSDQVLWGNVASALAGAMKVLAAVRPDHADATARLVESLLARGRLAGTGAVSRPDPSLPARSFLRRSCCLLYRVPGGGYCGDCVLTAVQAHRPRSEQDTPNNIA